MANANVEVLRSALVEWVPVEACPSCGSVEINKSEKLTKVYYVFGSVRIRVPPESKLKTCAKCSLIYKSPIPSKESISEITRNSQGELWGHTYDYLSELNKAKELLGGQFSILDVGAAGGQLLEAARQSSSRRSALDIVRFEQLLISNNGEFINSCLDDQNVVWSGTPYDAVTAFDVFEHLYDAKVAMENLARFVRPGGIAMIETGDACSVRFPSRWYYLSLFEHHMGWTLGALTLAAEAHGFVVVSVERKQHKTAGKIKPFTGWSKRMLYLAWPAAYHFMQSLGGFDGSIPPTPGKADHMRVVLKKNV